MAAPGERLARTSSAPRFTNRQRPRHGRTHVFEIDSVFGKMVCAMGVVSGLFTGHLRSALDLCMFIAQHEL